VAAAETRFRRDETPLPADVTGLGADAHAHIASEGASAGGGGAAIRMLLALGIVIALIFGLYKLLRRTTKGNGGAIRADGRITVVASAPLAPSRSLHLVRVGEELVLVGAGEQSVTPIRVYSADESRRMALDDPDDGMRPFGPAAGASPGFLGSFTDSLRKLTAR
jgi:flagellar biosynthetic protein FliO